MAKLFLKLIGNKIKTNEKNYLINKKKMKEINNSLDKIKNKMYIGWGEKYIKRVHNKKRMTAWERINYISDLNENILPIGTLVNHLEIFQDEKQDRTAPSAGIITVLTRINKRIIMIIANDNTVASGSWWPRTPEKIIRSQEIALKLNIPIIYLIDCSGLFLPEQRKSFPGQYGGGRIFKMNSLLSNKGIPQISGVMGDCIAGGGYMPIISDKVFMTENAYMVIAGAALIKGSKSEKINSNDIGGPHIHVHVSNCADFRVPDDKTCLDRIKIEISNLSSSSVDYYRYSFESSEPFFKTDEISSLLPINSQFSYDIKEIISRLIDDSLFHEVLPNIGKEVITGIARINGLYVGIASNVQGIIECSDKKKPGGILYKEGVAKLSVFSRTCNADGIPIIWLQDVSGFDIGEDAEKEGLLGFGSSLIYTNSTNTTPMCTVILRKSSGAGYYAMAGLPYDPIIQLATPIAKLGVMEGKTLSIGAFRSKLNDDFEIKSTDINEINTIKNGMKNLERRIDEDMNPYLAANNMDIDEIIKTSEIRKYLSYFVECCYQFHGIRRIKNPRIWSLHDLELLFKINSNDKKEILLKKTEDLKKENNFGKNDLFIKAPMTGIFYSKPSTDENNFIFMDDIVNKKQIIGLLEVMKNFYPIYTEFNYDIKIKNILVKNGQSVKVGQNLFLIIKK